MTYKHFNSTIKKQKTLKYSLIFILLSFFIFCLIYLSLFKFYPNSFFVFIRNIKKLFSFNSNDTKNNIENLWVLNLKLAWISIKYVVSGTFLGLFIAFFTAYWNSTNLYKHKLVPLIIKMLLLFLRSFPTVIFILLFKSSFETYLAAFAIFFWGTWLWMHRYFSEIIENSDVKQFWIDVNLGTKRFKSFYKNIVINNKNRFIMNSILAFESNLRWSTVLGTIGIYGIGILFDLYKNKFEYLGISLFYIVLIVFLLEIFIVFYNKYLSKNKSVMTQNINYNRNFKYWYKKAILFILYAFILVITIISLRDLFTQKINFYVIGNYFKNIFRPDFSYLKNNIWFYYQDYLDIFIFTYTSIIISFIFCYFTSFIIAEKFFFWKTSVFSKFILVIIKSIPILVYFSFFISIFNQNTALVLGLSIVAYRSFVKQISEKINSKTNKNCDILSNLGWSKWKIYKIYIFPQLQNDIKGIISFEFESTFRNVITYGLFTSVISIPNHLNLFQERTEYTKIIPLILPAMIFFILLETFFWIYKNNYFKIWFKKIQKI